MAAHEGEKAKMFICRLPPLSECGATWRGKKIGECGEPCAYALDARVAAATASQRSTSNHVVRSGRGEGESLTRACPKGKKVFLVGRRNDAVSRAYLILFVGARASLKFSSFSICYGGTPGDERGSQVPFLAGGDQTRNF